MDLLRSIQAFVTTVQAGSMSAAAVALRLSPAMVGQQVAALEARLGSRLLNRTTRRQSLTDFGASYYEQCRDILERIALADEAAQLQQAQARGRLRITAPTTFGAEALMPALGAYRDIAPDVEIEITLTDRTVDLVEEGFDIAFRIGEMPDSSMIARRLTPYRMVVCAAPSYLARAGHPTHPRDLGAHQAIAFSPSARAPWRFVRQQETVEVAPIRMVTVNSGPAVRAAALAGLGVIMQPEILVRRDLQEGSLLRLFADWHLRERSMWLLYYRDRQMTPRLRSFISFATSAFAAAEDAA